MRTDKDFSCSELPPMPSEVTDDVIMTTLSIPDMTMYALARPVKARGMGCA